MLGCGLGYQATLFGLVDGLAWSGWCGAAISWEGCVDKCAGFGPGMGVRASNRARSCGNAPRHFLAGVKLGVVVK